MTIPFTPQQFTHAQALLAAQTSVKVEASSSTSGSVHTPDVDFSYVYDGESLLAFTVTARNSFLARHASDATVEAHIAHSLIAL